MGKVGIKRGKNIDLGKLKFEVLPPEEYKKSIEILYGFHPSPFGQVLIGTSTKGICSLYFVNSTETSALEILRNKWPHALLKEDNAYTRAIAHNIFEKDDEISERQFQLLIKGTDFQIKVWEALTSIPEGTTRCYEDVACMIGNPKAVRASANAVAANEISYLIPCHRVISKSGQIHKYQWGTEVKKAILEFESTKKNR